MPTLKLISIYTKPYTKIIRTFRPNPQFANSLRQFKKVSPFTSPLVLRHHPLLPNSGFRNCKCLSSYSTTDNGVNNGGITETRNGGLSQKDDDEKDVGGEESKLLTLPTLLTIARVAAVPVLVSTFYMDSWLGTTATTCIFVFASVTDWLDGYLARKMKLSSQFGAFLDPVADKLMVATTLILLCTKPLVSDTFGQMPWLLTVPAIAIISREITMSAVREWAASQDCKLLAVVAVNNLGKWKTATQMTALTILLAARDSSLVGANGLVATGVILLYISSWLALWSLFVYIKKISKVLLK